MVKSKRRGNERVEKIRIIAILLGILLAGYLAWQIYISLFAVDIKYVPQGDLYKTVTSPDEWYTLRFYRSSGGATTGFAMLGIMEDKKVKEKRRIYWEYPCREVSVKWRRDVVIINNTRLNIWTEVYDFRLDQPIYPAK